MYLALYRDSAYQNLFFSFPALHMTYSSHYGGNPRTFTYSGKSYRYFDDSGYRFYDAHIPNAAATFDNRRNRVPHPTNMYFKNGLRVEVKESTDTDDSGGGLRYWTIGGQQITSGSAQSTGATSYTCSSCVEFEYAGVKYIGFSEWTYNEPWNTLFTPIFCVEESFWKDAIQPPYDYGGKDDPDGGHGSGSYGHTGVTDTPAPLGLMPTGGRGLHYYKIDGPAYQSLQGFLWGETGTLAKSLWAKFVNKTHTPVSCVVGCFALPQLFAPAGSGSSPIQLAGVQLSPISGTCVPFSPACVDKEFSFSPQAGAYKNFADYTHTSCKLYVPFCGSIPIPMELALNRTIKIRYRVDQANGNLCAAIFAGDCVVGELSGNCAYQIPVSGGDTGALEVLGATVTGLVQISTGDIKGALQSGAEALSAQHTTHLINGDLSGNVSYCSLRKPYIEYTRNATTYTEYYNDVLGIPARVGGTLQSFSGGYGQFEIMEKDINIPEATAAEKEEIASLLRGGVIV